MEDNEKSLDLTNLDKKTTDIANQILQEEDIERVKDLTNLFNLNAQKRNVMRVIKMTDLLDKVTNQITNRFDKRPDNFTNEELLKYLQVVEDAIDRANNNLNLIEETPPIQLQQNNQVNININHGLDRDSRDRVLEAVRAILANANDATVTDITNIEEENVDRHGEVGNDA